MKDLAHLRRELSAAQGRFEETQAAHLASLRELDRAQVAVTNALVALRIAERQAEKV